MKDLRCKLSTCLIILLIIVMCISAAGCAKPPVDPSVSETPTDNTTSLPIPTFSSSPTRATDPPPTTSVPTQPTEPPATEPDPNALTAEEIAELQNIYQLVKTENGQYVTNFYNAALGMEYANPWDISLISLFREGDQRTSVSDEEYEFIKSADSNAEYLDWYRISTQDVERILQMCFGLSISDMRENLAPLHYWDKTDCYYSGTTSPAPYVDNLIITGGTYLEDGNLLVFYTSQQGNWGQLEQHVMMLKPVAGGYHILFNQRLRT